MENDREHVVVDGALQGGVRLETLVDAPSVRRLVEDFHALTGHVISIVDLEGEFLVRVGWHEACLGFHRAHPDSCALCQESDVEMTDKVPRGESRAYRCKNGLWHVVTPLFLGDRHLGNVFTSQFFFDDEEIDLAGFAERADRFGYDRDAYLAAIEAIPRYSHGTIDSLMRFYARLAEQIATLGLTNLELAETMAAREKALRASEANSSLFTQLVASAPIPIALIDAAGRTEYLNDEFTRVLGYSARDVPDIETWRVAVHPDVEYRAESVALWMTDAEEAAEGDGRIRAREYRLTCKNGEVRDIVISGALVGDRTLILMHDVTDSKKADAALRQSEAKFAAAYRTSPDAVNINRVSDGLYLEVNEGFTALTGYTPEDVAGKTSSEIQIWADPADRERLVRGLAADGVVTNLEARFRKKDGTFTTALMSARIMEVEGVPCILSVTRDISERKKAETLLRESQRIARVGHYEWDIVRDRWDASEVLMDIFGIDESYPRDLEGFLGIVHADDRAMVGRYVVDEVIKRKRPFDKEYRITRVRDGADRWVHGLGDVTYNDSGEPVALFGIIQDVTDRKRAEEAVLESNARLDRMVYDVAETMGRIVEARDPYTQGHQQRVASLGKRIATRMGLSKCDVDEVEMAGLLHDVGKLRIPTEILTKPGRLSPTEFALVKDHPEQGHEILKAIAFPWAVADIAMQHHERMDGSGYPAGLAGDEILVAARILAVADVVEAMASHRPYRPTLGVDAALEEITSHPEFYDADVVASLVSLHADGELGL